MSSAPASQPPRDLATRLREIQERCRPGVIEPTSARLMAACVQIQSGIPYLCGHCFACQASLLLRDDVPFLLAEIDRLGAIVGKQKADLREWEARFRSVPTTFQGVTCRWTGCSRKVKLPGDECWQHARETAALRGEQP